MKLLTVVMQHATRWGMVWWGVIFIGSVLRAIGTRAFPDANTVAVTIVAAAVGLAAGTTAKVRGQWI